MTTPSTSSSKQGLPDGYSCNPCNPKSYNPCVNPYNQCLNTCNTCPTNPCILNSCLSNPCANQPLKITPEDLAQAGKKEVFNFFPGPVQCNRCNPYEEDAKLTKTIQIVLLLPRMFALVLLLAAWLLFDIYINMVAGPASSIMSGVIAFSVGVYLGKKDVRSWFVHKNCCTELVTIPRNYAVTMLVVLTVVLKAFWAYFYLNFAVIPNWMYLVDIVTSALVTGFFVARSYFFFKNYLHT